MMRTPASLLRKRRAVALQAAARARGQPVAQPPAAGAPPSATRPRAGEVPAPASATRLQAGEAPAPVSVTRPRAAEAPAPPSVMQRLEAETAGLRPPGRRAARRRRPRHPGAAA